MKICSGSSQRDSGVHSQTPIEAGRQIWLMLVWALTAWSVVWPLQEGISQSKHYRSMLSGAGILRVNPQEVMGCNKYNKQHVDKNTKHVQYAPLVIRSEFQMWINWFFLYWSRRNYRHLGFQSFGMMTNEADFTLCTVVTAFSSPWKYMSYKIINNPDVADNWLSNNKDHFMNNVYRFTRYIQDWLSFYLIFR